MSTQLNIQSYILAAEGAAAPAQPTAAPAAPASPATATAPVGEAGKPVDATHRASQEAGDTTGSMIMLLVLMAVMMIFMFILPARARKKQQKKFDEMYKGLKRDDRIMLQNGKFVTVDRVEDERIFVFADTARNVREEYHRNAVSMLATEAMGEKKKAEAVSEKK